MINNFPDQNLCIVFGSFFIFLLVISQICFFLGLWTKKRWPERAHESSDFIPSTILGLLSLILGFTFSMAINRFDQRKDLVLKEANAIGTTFLRSQLLNQTNGKEVRNILKKYVDARLDFFDTGSDRSLIEQAEKKAVLLQNQLWVQTVQVTQQERGPLAAQFVAALNELIDRQAERTVALRNTIPGIVYWISLIIASIGLGSLAFSRAVQKGSGRWNISLLVLLFACVFTLIQDLDCPRAGAIVVSQEAMRTLKQSLSQAL